MTNTEMNTETGQGPTLGAALAAIRGKWKWVLLLGIVYTFAGFVALGSVVAATVASVFVVGAMMILAGIFEIASAFQMKTWGQSILWVLLGALYVVGGFVAFQNPALAASILTLILGWSHVFSGLLRIFLATKMKEGTPWIWVVISGIITVALGGMIIAQWPASGAFVLGIFLGVDLVFAGFGWIQMALAIRKI